MLASAAWAVQWTALALRFGAAQAGVPVRLGAGLTPRDVQEGTVSFTSDGEPIPGCQAVPVKASETECVAVFPEIGAHMIGASYSGSESWAPSVAPSKKLTVGKSDAWVYIAMDPEAPVYGNGLIITALALGAQGGPFPTGTFTFYDNGRQLVTRAVKEDRTLWDTDRIPGARAALDMPLPAGEHQVRAVYNGDGSYNGWRQVSIDFTVGKGKPVVAISSTPAQIGQAVMVSASVTARNPTGSVTFEGIPQCAGVALDATGFARCKTVYAQLGEYPVTAAYSGDANLEAGSATLRIGVSKAIAGFYAASSPGSAVAGQAVRVSALLMGAPGLPRPSGLVTFTSEASPGAGAAAIDGEGRATWNTSFPAGVQRVMASFAGDANYAPAAAPVTFPVGRAETTTSLSAPAGGPLSATVTAVPPGGGVPTGNVRFLRDGTLIGTAPLTKGVATFLSTAAGNYTAQYLGDNNYSGGDSTATAPSPKVLVMLSSDRNPAAQGQPVTLTAVVMPNPGTVIPTGAVRFTSDGAALGTAALVAGQATLTATLAPGSHGVEAAYSGDAIYPAASGSLAQVVTGLQSGMGLSASDPAPVAGQPVTFTAQLASGGSGTVRFAEGAAVLGSATLNGGAASLTVPVLAAGAHTITASWSGDAMYAAATAELSITVARASTVTFLTLGTGAASARVSALAPGAGTPGGTVRFIDPRTDTLLASATLANGSATAVLPRDAVLVAAAYSGDANFVESVSETASALAVVNAASYAGGAVAPEEIVTLFGPIPAGLASVRVTDRDGATRDARVLHSTAGQAAVVLPAGLAMGPATVVAGEWQAPATVAAVAPGLFTANASGKGAPAGLTDPIEIGDDGAVIVLYGTGWRHAGKVVCLVGGQPVEVLYAGGQAEFPGLDQANIVLPASLRGAGAVLLELKADGAAANPVLLTLR